MRGKRERTKTVKYIWSGLLFLAVSGILTLIARISLSFSEWYSTYIYKGLVSVIGRLFGKVPFSFVELSLYVVIFLMIGTGIHAAFESRKAGRKAIWQWLAGLFLGGCIMLFVFVINCGINYHRESFSEKSGLKIQTYSVKDLQATCQWLTEEVNRLSTQRELKTESCSCRRRYDKKQSGPCRHLAGSILRFRDIIRIPSRCWFQKSCHIKN